MHVIHLNRRRLAMSFVALSIAVLAACNLTDAAVRSTTADIDSAIRHVPVSERVIALTFDDGPDADFTLSILATLRAHGAKATFFVVGTQIEYFPEVLRQMSAEGHEIGSHTYSHLRLSGVSPERFRKELTREADLIVRICGVTPVCFRPPYGAMNAAQVEVLREYGYSLIMWDQQLDSRDWERPGVGRIVERVVRNARPGGIVLMHDGGGHRSQTVAALPAILEQLSAQGYRFVTVSELLRLSDEARARGSGRGDGDGQR